MSAKELQDIISQKFTEQVLHDMVTIKSGLGEVQITKLDIKTDTGKKGDSYLSNICRFSIEANGTNKEGKKETVSFPVIVKFLPKNIARCKTFRSADFFENEVIFYEKVWTRFQEFQEAKKIENKFDNIPLVLASHIDGSNDYIAMVDISYEGYRSAERGSGLNYDYTIAILSLLAEFHALSLAFKDQQPDVFEAAASSLKETYFAEKYRKWYIKFQELRLFTIARDAVQKELPPQYLEKLNKLIDKDFYGTLCELCETKRPLSVVTHGDVWVPNFLIKYTPDSKIDKITMIDFQLTRYATLANDLTFFLYSCVDFAVLEQNWDKFLAEYHKCLSKTLSKLGSRPDLVSLEAIKQEIKECNVFGIGMSIEGLVMSQLEDDEVSDLDGIEGVEAVPLENVWTVQPFKEQEKRKRIASMIKFAVDRKFI